MRTVWKNTGNTRGWVYTDYEAPKGCVDISGYEGNKKKVTVPKKIKGKKVLSIYGYGTIQQIHIPKGIEAKFISTGKNLKKITVDKDHKLYTVKNKLLLSKDKTTLLGCPQKIIKPKFPKTVKIIGEHAFEESPFESFTVPKNIEKINYWAFRNCRNLKKIKFNKNLKEIGSHAFQGCESLKSVTIPNSVKKLSSGVFADCTNLTKVKLSNKLTKIENHMFENCTSLEEVRFPSSVKTIAEYSLVRSSLRRVYFYNKNCEILYKEDWRVVLVGSPLAIYGYKGSTAEKYAEKNGNKFFVLKSK